MTRPLAPFPWHGGKSRVADLVWARFGAVPNYVEPFAGSLAVLLGRPHAPKVETVNDLDALLVNFWRAVKWAPAQVAEYSDWPVSEVDMHARHAELVERKEALRARLLADPRAYDTELAGWWVWGVCQWIGGGWGHRYQWKGRVPSLGNARGHGITTLEARPLEKKRPHLSRPGRGILKTTTLPSIGEPGRGVLAKKPATGSIGKGVHAQRRTVLGTMAALAARLRRVRIVCGDWKRVLGRSTLGIDVRHGMSPCGVFFDPPYDVDQRKAGLYAEDEPGVAADVREWAIANGDNPDLRIALCGFEGEHDMPTSWSCVAWKSQGGHENAARERIWFSPHCLNGVMSEPLFARRKAATS